jgi:thiamine biosynthesis lipoprotein
LKPVQKKYQNLFKKNSWKNFNLGILFLGLLLVSLTWGLSKTNQSWRTQEQEILGTVVSVRLWGQPQTTEKVFKKIFDEFKRIEKITNLVDPQSEISELNRYRKVTVSDDLWLILNRSLWYAKWSNGSFDPTVGAFTMAYQVKPHRISEYEKQKILKGVGFQYLKLNSKNKMVILSKPETLVDVWGSAKGYAADRALAIIRSNGVKSALLNLGGQVTVWGKNVGKPSWQVAVEDSRDPQKTIGTMILKSGQTLSTSALSQRSKHIYHPQNGEVPAEFLSVSIVADSGIDADILSTAVFVMGTAEKLQSVKAVKGYLILRADGEVLNKN